MTGTEVDGLRFGVHLPQSGRAAGPEGITRAAKQAEDLGFADVWVSDHLVVPTTASYPPPFLYEPIVTLTWAAAATSTIGLGTSVLVLPYRHPVHIAKELSSLENLSGGRLVIGVGSGSLEGEFAALGADFAHRGAVTDEALDVMRACWSQRPVNFSGRRVRLEDMQFLPQPRARVPIWVGGTAEPSLRRAVAKGDGWHGAFVEDTALPEILARLRRDRPEPEFVLSNRVNWDGLRSDPNEIAASLETFRNAGLQHVVAVPAQSTVDDWLSSVEKLAAQFGLV